MDLTCRAVTTVAGMVVAGGTVLAAVLHLLNGADPAGVGVTDWWVMGLTAAVSYGGVGAWLSWLQPRQVVGWVLVAIGASAAVSMTALEYGIWALDREVPGETAALWLGNWLWVASIVPIVSVLPLLLPDGRLPSRRWRPALVLGVAAVAMAAAPWAFAPYDATTPELAAAGVVNPVLVPFFTQPGTQAFGIVLAVLGPVVGVAGAVARWRRATGATRQQLKWVLLGVGASLALFAAGFAWGPSVTALAMLPLPVGIGVAASRYGLWDVDVVISRSLIYAALVVGVVTAYVAVVALLGDALGRNSGAPILVTALVAVAVEPVHRRLRALVNRLVHGSPDDPHTALAKIGRRLEAVEDGESLAEEVLPQLLGPTARSLRLEHASVELGDGSEVVHGCRGAVVERLALVYGGQAVGTLVVTPGRALNRSDRRRLGRLADQVAVAAHSALLARALRGSREQLVTAREEERRRLYRDLHDGLGPSLAALALNVEVARQCLDTDAERTRALLDRVLPRLRATVAEVRTVVHGLRPPALDDLGLAAAIRELAGGFAGPRLSVRVEGDGDLVGLPAATEVATYRIVAEALNNAIRHADASQVVVRLARDGDDVRVSVEDDGRGVGGQIGRGIGVASMTGRAEELGGRLRLGPGADGRGTTVQAVLPAVAP